MVCLRYFIIFLGLFFFEIGSNIKIAYALEWQLRPNLNLSGIYDDNLNLAETGKKNGFVSEVMPGFVLRGQSPWSNVSLNYRLQGLYNAEGDDATTVYHQLHMRALLQPIRNTFYVQTSSSVSQQNTTNNFLALDNIAGKPNLRTQTENFSIAPYFTPHFGQYASGLLKFGYAGSYFSDPSTSVDSTQVSNPISNSGTITKQAGLNSGTFFNMGSWNLAYYDSEQRNASGSDIHFEDYIASGKYFIHRKLNLFANTAYENNSYATQVFPVRNGFAYTLGFQWIPSLWYSLTAGYGNNSYVTMQYNPDENLTAHVTYKYNNVGLNLHSSWDANVNYNTALTRWILAYHQDTTTVQQILLNQDTFSTNESTGALSTPFIINLPTLVNDVLINKTADFNFSYQLGKSALKASVYNVRRSYQLSQELDSVYGATGSWHWQIIPRLTYYLQPRWQTTFSTLAASNINLYGVVTGLTRGIPINLGRPLLLNTTLELRHMEQLSSNAGDSYTENRATASFFVQF